MTNIQLFSHCQFGDIRVLTNENNDPFFVGNDAARILGYSNPRDAIVRHCKSGGVVKHDIPINGINQTVTIINEPNFYRLVMKSNMPDAEKVQDWVCEDVLPSIRKTGGYIVEKEGDTDDDILSRALLIAQDKIRQREQRINMLEEENRLNKEQIKEAAPKVQYFDEVLQSKSTYTATQLAKELGFRTAEQLNLDLKKRKIQFHQSGQWMLTANYAGRGLSKNRTTPFLRSDGSEGSNTIMVWTEAGRKFLHELYDNTNNINQQN